MPRTKNITDPPLDPCPLARHPYWRALCDLIDDEVICEISHADYGRDQPEHERALRRILDINVQDFSVDPHPREVLELSRWTDVTDPQAPDAAAWNMERWWSSTALLIGSSITINSGWIRSIDDNLATLLVSHRISSAIDDCMLLDFLDALESLLPQEYDDDIAFLAAAQGIACLWADSLAFNRATCAWHRCRASVHLRVLEGRTLERRTGPWRGLLKATMFAQRATYWANLLNESLAECQRLNHSPAILELMHLKEGHFPC